MRKRSGRLVFSPSDLITYLESPFASWMDRFHLEHPAALAPDPAAEDDKLVAAEGERHEQRYVERLREAHDVWTPPREGDRFQATLDAMRAGREIVFQAELRHEKFEGKADFLRRVDEPSALGAWSYEIVDTKLARTPKPYFLIQLCAYAKMLEAAQGTRPRRVYIVGGDGVEHAFRTDDYFFYFRSLERAFLEEQHAFDPEKRPLPEARAEHRRWTSHADKILEELDHPSRIAGIGTTQVKRLAAAGVATMRAVAESTLPRVPRMDDTVFARLRQQARLQRDSAGLARPLYELVPPSDGDGRRGLALLPPPSPGDVFFDMEGYPFAEGGLEYLFGASVVERGERQFVDFWAHDEATEKRALEGFIDWAWARFRDDHAMHIYHYASYEVTALRRLMGKYGTREDVVDAMLRAEVFVDLFKVVRQSLRIGEPRYSLKNVEHLYRTKRAGDVATAGESVAQYARWLAEPDGGDWKTSTILAAIRDYNREDCESTLDLRDWLLARQTEAKVNYIPPLGHAERDPLKISSPPKSPAEIVAQRMLGAIPEDRSADPERWRIHELLANLLLFHRREAKPIWWAMFDRQERSHVELVEDADCLGLLTRTEKPPVSDKKSRLFEYRFDPEQDTKMGTGKCYIAEDLTPTDLVILDLEAGIAVLRVGPSRSAPPPVLSLIPDEFVSAQKISDAIERIAEAWDESGALPGPLDTLLRRLPPRVSGHPRGEPLTNVGDDLVARTTEIVAGLEQSAVAIQGPPGAGKTFTAAAAIAALLAGGKRVGIASNGHRAIEKLMIEVLNAAKATRVDVRAAKIKSQPDEEIVVDGRAAHAAAMKNVVHTGANAPNLVGGTAWAFADPTAAGRFDYLFVDEAGQVSLANIVGMSGAARNLVLLGDQMQLSQPTQGSHPPEAGLSALDYLLGERRTIPSELGVFLGTTWRMHPAVCKFISGAIYEDRLASDPDCERRRVEVAPDAKLIRSPAGLIFLPVAHEGNTQASDEEVEVVRAIVSELRGRTISDKTGKTRALVNDDVLIVAPYNSQVRRLSTALPGLRVGSVDKFQGQEAPVVILSMCASNAESSARGLTFLFSPNRLNVAISRAQCIAIVVGAPRLAHARVNSVEQMRLANLFCRVVEEGT